jgi:Protein of unknown function (DUF3662)/Inner membrane component of T3SS, cytoplasmic domain
MRPLASLERFFERLFEGQSARLFHTKLQPIQLQRRVERAMESGRTRDGDQTVVPHRFAVHLASLDLAALRESHPTLAGDLADAALEFARSHHYRLADRPTVALVADVSIEPGDVLVATGAEPEHLDDAAVTAPPGLSAEHTAVFVVPTVDAPKARLREVRPDGTTRAFTLDGRPLTIGRAPDNGLVLFDGRVSRHHARLYGRRGALLLADLGSTNGSWVNDRRIEEMALGEGDRIRVGDTILVVESFEDA